MYNDGDIVDTKNGKLLIIGKETIIKNNKKRNFYKYRCLICDNIDIIRDDTLSRGSGCRVCCPTSQKVKKGYNDVATTNPELIKYFVNNEDVFRYTSGSHMKVTLKCDICGVTQTREVRDFCKRGFQCECNSFKVSFPEKFMLVLLSKGYKEGLVDKYIFQPSKNDLGWCENKRYDFYFIYEGEEYIIETHGGQHYKGSFEKIGGKSLKMEEDNDRYKKNLALCNGIKEENYIVVDCRQSSIDYIKKSIATTKLKHIFSTESVSLSDINLYNETLVNQVSSLWECGTGVVEISRIMNMDKTTVRKILKFGSDIAKNTYSTKESLIRKKENLIKCSVKSKSKKIKCLTLNKFYYSYSECCKDLKQNYNIVLTRQCLSRNIKKGNYNIKGLLFEEVD